MRVVTRSFLRYLARRRGLSFLQLFGIAFGVAAVAGMFLSSRSALSSFAAAVDFLGGEATHSLQRPAGAMDDGIVARLMADPAVRSLSPVVDRRVLLEGDEPARLLGVDWFLDRKIRPGLTRAALETGPRRFEGSPGERFLLEPDAVIADERLASRLGVRPGDSLGSNRGPLRLLATFPNPAGEPLVLMDIAHAQELFGLRGMIDRVDLALDDEAGFRSRWETGFIIQSGAQRAETLSAMLRAFRLNLQALSLLALLVGVFLIYNTAMFAVVSRRRDAGILRALGAHRSEVASAFMVEVALLGFVGGALGGALGWALARFLTGLIGGTVSSLYFFLRPTPPAWSWAVPPAGAVLGAATALAGALFPLAELVRTDPAEAIHGRTAHRGSATRARKAALAGLAVLAASLALLPLAAVNVYFGFAGAFGFLLGVSLLSGVVLVLLSRPLKRLLGLAGGLPGKVAAGYLRRNLGRAAVAVAAFTVALSMSLGLGSMIGSFRRTLLWWMDTQLMGDMYIGNNEEAQVDEEFYAEVRDLPGVGGVDVFRNVRVLLDGSPIQVASIDAVVLKRFARFAWLAGGDEHWDAVRDGDVVVSESFLRRFGIGQGETIELEGMEGMERLRIAGVFYDYTTEHGLVMMDRATYLRLYGDRSIGTLGVFLEPGLPENAKTALLDDLRRRAGARGLPAKALAEFRAGIMDIFDATFAVTRSMRVLAVIVALFGIAGALTTLFMERTREFGVYRALGFSRRQVALMTLLEGLGLGLVSFLMAAWAGTGLAYILIRVINLHSFNWTVFFSWAWEPYVGAFLVAIAAGAAASLYPLWKVWRTYPEMQIREE